MSNAGNLNHRLSRPVKVGSVTIGGGAPVSVQGMTKVKTAQYGPVLRQLKQMQSAGAEIIRLAIRDEEDLVCFSRLKEKIHVPLVADIHFRSDLALGAIKAGADKIRLNPGNISDPKKLAAIIRAAGKTGTAIRIGVNAGSLKNIHPHLTSPVKGEEDQEIVGDYKPQFLPPGGGGVPTKWVAVGGMVRAMVSAAGDYLRFFEAEGFRSVVVSLKASSVPAAILANREFRRRFDYPLHLGITESGRGSFALVKSAVGLGCLLQEGIGDTIRVSLSEPPEAEIRSGREILQALGLRSFYPEIISCPKCGRCQVAFFRILGQVEKGLKKLAGYPERYAGLKIAVMGCEVNGPGEAAAADIGIACGREQGQLFSHGRITARKIPEKKLAERLLAEIRNRVE